MPPEDEDEGDGDEAEEAEEEAKRWRHPTRRQLRHHVRRRMDRADTETVADFKERLGNDGEDKYKAGGDDDGDDGDDGDDDDDDDDDDNDDGSNGGGNYLIKNFHYGGGWNWTYQLLPPHLQDKGQVGMYQTSPVDGGASLYAIAKGCIARSDDHGDTWGECWILGTGVLANFTGEFTGLEIKDESTMFINRSPGPPLRTKDGGASWQPLESLAVIGATRAGVYSWSGKTLAMFNNGGTQSADHPHTAYLWKSTDDGDTWTDETADIVTNGAGISQWYGGTLYMSSGGQGIFAKKLE